ncbi:MAG: cytochrome c oxidase subunit II [Mycobacteriaceae bacterium]|nr:cytochrome c oxidase subunit II [Mycobacteriaceae bacterium]
MLSVSGCSTDNVWLRFGWPSGVTPQAERMRNLWTWSVLAALAMGVLVWGLTFWTIAFHRKKKDSPEFPRQTGYNVPLELSYTAIPFLIIAALFYFTVDVENYVNDRSHRADVVVDVTAYQWNWKFGYRTVDMDGVKYDGANHGAEAALREQDKRTEEATEDGHPQPGAIYGKDPSSLSYLHVDHIQTVGSSSEIPVLVVPIGKLIEFQLSSADVIHGFWVPEFLEKRDVNPNPAANHSDNIIQLGPISREGAFVGRCTEMCGTFHSMMNFEVRAVTPDKFARYLDARRRGADNAEALRQIRETPIATSTHPFDTRRRIQDATASSAGK